MGFAGGPVAGDVKMPVVHTRDIGRVIAARLMEPRETGISVEYVLGERDLSYNEIVGKLGEAIGRTDLNYIHFPPDQSRMGLQQFGFSRNVADLIVDLALGVNEGQVLEDYRRTAGNTTETSIEQFAEEFAQLFNR
jgi:uncharacterized protein YbjT (DUF2867 family)